MVIAFFVGLVVGGGVMFFVYRKNRKKIDQIELAVKE